MDLRAVIFIPALVAAALCVFFFLTFAANYYLTVLESTASGAKEVAWVPETIIDNFWKPFYLAWLLCLWLGPAYVIGRSLAKSSGVPWLALAVPVGVAWLLYPVSQLSSLSSSSVWAPLHPQVFARLIQKPAVLLGFFAFTLPVFALAGIAFKWAFLTADEWYLLFVGTPLIALAMLLYARLLGRLAFALMFTRDLLKRKKKKKPKPKAKEQPKLHEPEEADVPAPAMVQPSELPPIHTPDGELAGYNVLVTDDPPSRKKRVVAEVAEEEADAPPSAKPAATTPARRPPSADPSRVWTDDDDDTTPYEAKPAEVEPEERTPSQVVKPSADELALLARTDVPKRPKTVWNAEVLAFLGQPGTISALMLLTLLGTLAGAAVRVARMFNPVAGGE